MELNKFKAENFWLRLGLTLMILVYLGSISIVNRQVYQNTKIDSTSYYKLKTDTLTKIKDSLSYTVDSLNNEVFIRQTIIGRYEMGLDFLKERRPNEHNLVMNYISTQTE